jgi:ribosomal protein S27AE
MYIKCKKCGRGVMVTYWPVGTEKEIIDNSLCPDCDNGNLDFGGIKWELKE